MKVSIVVGGRWHAFDLAQQLCRRNVLHRLVTSYPRFVVRRWDIPDKHVVSMPSSQVFGRLLARVSSRASARGQYLLHRWFAHSAARHLDGSDLLVCWSSFAEPALAWAAERGIPSLVERGSAHISEQGGLLRREYQSLGLPWAGIHPAIEAMELREYERCTQISVPSIFVERSFTGRGFSKDRVFRNMYGVDLSSFGPPDSSPAPPTVDALHAVFAGAISVQKGVPHLLKGFARSRGNNWTLSMAGGREPGWQRWWPRRCDGIKLLGHVPQTQLRELYGRAHCLVLPSIHDGFGMVLSQALACGLPIICSSNTGGEDLLRLGGPLIAEHHGSVREFPAGFVVPIGDSEAIGWSLRRLAQDPDLWLEKQRSSLAIASDSLGWEHYGRRAVVQYEMLATRGAGLGAGQ